MSVLKTVYWLHTQFIMFIPIENATMQNRFRELDIFSFLLSEGLIPITDSGTSDHFR